MGKILARGHSTVLVCYGNPKNIIGLLLVCVFHTNLFKILAITFVQNMIPTIHLITAFDINPNQANSLLPIHNAINYTCLNFNLKRGQGRN